MNRRKSLFNSDDDNYSMVAAIEIGTSYSGFAYATRRDSRPIGQHIVMNPVWLSPDKSMTTLRLYRNMNQTFGIEIYISRNRSLTSGSIINFL